MRLLVLAGTVCLLAVVGTGDAAPAFPARTLDGGGNNVQHPEWGRAGTQYLRVAAPTFADGVASMSAGPPTRYVSNRIFNDVGQNLFSENGVSQWGWAWGQFIDHDFGLRDETPAESAPIAFDAGDPLEAFTNDFGAIGFSRTPAAPGTGVSSPRQQINTISSFIDASNVYGTTPARLDWLREGPVDGSPSNNGAKLLLTSSGYLPRADARGNPAAAPPVDLMGQLVMTPSRAAIAGDVRANENIALTGLHTLFAREHNRIVRALPRVLSDEAKFEIARRVVGAEIQWITYNEFLPALGVGLSRYRGYNPRVNPSLSNEFAVVGYRAHSMIHGEFEPTVPAGTFSDAQLAAFEASGVEVEEDGDDVTLGIPLNLAFGNPDLLEKVGLGTLLASLGGESQYKNDEQIDNALRSVLFQVPKPGSPDPAGCMLPAPVPDCFSGVVDLGAIDIERGRDHGMPSYNALRRAYGLSTKRSFTDITGEVHREVPVGSPDLGELDRRSEHPRLRPASRCRGQRACRRQRRGRGRDSPLDARRPPEGRVRERRSRGRVRRHGLGVPSAKDGARAPAARNLEEAVRSVAGRRPVLLPQRPRAVVHLPVLPHRLPEASVRDHRAEHRRRRGAERLQGSCIGPVTLPGPATDAGPGSAQRTRSREADFADPLEHRLRGGRNGRAPVGEILRGAGEDRARETVVTGLETPAEDGHGRVRMHEVRVDCQRPDGPVPLPAQSDESRASVLGPEGREVDLGASSGRIRRRTYRRVGEREAALDGVDPPRRADAVEPEVPRSVDGDADGVDANVGPRSPRAPCHPVLDSGALAAEPYSAAATRAGEREQGGDALTERLDAGDGRGSSASERASIESV